VSENLWKYFQEISNQIISGTGPITEEYYPQAAVSLKLFLSKNPEVFAQVNLQGRGALQIYFDVVSKMFKVAQDSENEFIEVTPFSMLMNLVEYYPLETSHLNYVLDLALQRMNTYKTTDLKLVSL